jgi:hypothetical protein
MQNRIALRNRKRNGPLFTFILVLFLAELVQKSKINKHYVNTITLSYVCISYYPVQFYSAFSESMPWHQKILHFEAFGDHKE